MLDDPFLVDIYLEARAKNRDGTGDGLKGSAGLTRLEFEIDVS